MRFLAALLVVALALTGCGRDEPEHQPRLTGDLVSGGQYDPAGHAGKIVVVNFWGSWCAPCRYETPELIAAYDATKADGVEFLGINVRDPNRDQSVAFVESFKVPYPSIYDPKGRLALEFDLPPSTIPATVILGRDGRVVAEFRKPLTRDELVGAIHRASG